MFVTERRSGQTMVQALPDDIVKHGLSMIQSLYFQNKVSPFSQGPFPVVLRIEITGVGKAVAFGKGIWIISPYCAVVMGG